MRVEVVDLYLVLKPNHSVLISRDWHPKLCSTKFKKIDDQHIAVLINRSAPTVSFKCISRTHSKRINFIENSPDLQIGQNIINLLCKSIFCDKFRDSYSWQICFSVNMTTQRHCICESTSILRKPAGDCTQSYSTHSL